MKMCPRYAADTCPVYCAGRFGIIQPKFEPEDEVSDLGPYGLFNTTAFDDQLAREGRMARRDKEMLKTMRDWTRPRIRR